MVYWIWLRQIKGIGPIIEKRLLDYFLDPENIFYAGKEDFLKIEGIGEVIAEKIISQKCLISSYKILEEVEKKNIRLLTYMDPLYPTIAKDYPQAPTLLYYRGHIRESFNSVAIVGSRRCSQYGKEVAIEASKFLAENNIAVISGLAKGIDGYAHISCLKNNGYTIAFLGNGIDICYPSEHRELMDGIIENGAVISEYPPGTKGRNEYFPKRNGLISSWSEKLLLVEASEKSGALITAEISRKLKRPVYAVAHSIYSQTGRGSNLLIGEAANLYISPCQLLLGEDSNKARGGEMDIVKNKGEFKKLENTGKLKLTDLENQIINCLSQRPKRLDEIFMDLNLSQIDLIQQLSIMELEGLIETLPGGKYGCK